MFFNFYFYHIFILSSIFRYFRAGADKISIGGDAVYAVEDYLRSGLKTGKSSIEQISK